MAKIISKRRLDIPVEDVVPVELKALKEVDNSEMNQVLNYLRVFKIEVGLLPEFWNARSFFQEIYSYSKQIIH